MPEPKAAIPFKTPGEPYFYKGPLPTQAVGTSTTQPKRSTADLDKVFEAALNQILSIQTQLTSQPLSVADEIDRVLAETLTKIQSTQTQLTSQPLSVADEIDRVLAETLTKIQSTQAQRPLDLRGVEGAAYVDIFADPMPEVQEEVFANLHGSRLLSYLSDAREDTQCATQQVHTSQEEQDFDVLDFLWSVLGEEVLGDYVFGYSADK